MSLLRYLPKQLNIPTYNLPTATKGSLLSYLGKTIQQTQTTPQGVFPYGKFMEGSRVMKLGDVLNIGQYAQVGLTEKALENYGILQPTEQAGLLKGIEKRASNIELLRRIGEEKVGEVEVNLKNTFLHPVKTITALATGSYKPSTSVMGNFIKELPVVTAGLALDIFFDPNPVKYIAKAFKVPTNYLLKSVNLTEEALSKSNTKGAKAIVGAMRWIYSKSFAQPEEFKKMITTQYVAEEMAKRQVNELTKPLFAFKPAEQQRMTQIRKGGISVSGKEAPLREGIKPLAGEIEAAGDVISKTSPFLLARQTYEALKTTYVGKMFAKYEDETADTFAQTFGGYKTAIPTSRFIHRKNFATAMFDLDEEVYDKAIKIQGQMADIETRGNKLLEQIDIKKKWSDWFGKKSVQEFLGGDAKRLSNQQKIQIGRLKEQSDGLEKQFDQLGGKQIKLFSGLEGFFTLPSKEKQIISGLVDAEKIEGKGSVIQIAKDVKDVLEIGKGLITKEEFFNQASLGKFINFYNERINKSLGEIKEFGFLAGKTAYQEKLAASRVQFFDEVATRFSKGLPEEGYIQMPSEIKKFGNLANKYIPWQIADTILETYDPKTINPITQAYLRALYFWKATKTAYQPSTSSRNITTNYLFLNPLGGVPIYRLDLYGKATVDYYKGTPLYKEADVYLRRTSLGVNELRDAAKMYYEQSKDTQSLFGSVGKFHDYVVDFYGGQDKFFKWVNVYKGVTEDGLSVAEAAQRANFSLVNYNDMPKFIEWLRKTPIGLPFVSFTFGVTKPIANALLNEPEKIAKWFKVMNAINRMNPHHESPILLQQEREALPERLKDGTFLRLPIKDKYKRAIYFDLDYLLPLNIIEPSTYLGENPFLQALSGLKNIATGKAPIDTWTQEPIYDETYTTEDKANAIERWILQLALPNWTPIPFKELGEPKLTGTAAQKIYKAFSGKAESKIFPEKKASKIRAIFDALFGIKTTAVDTEEQQVFKQIEKKKKLDEVQNTIFRIMTNPNIEAEERQRKMQQYMDKIGEIISE